MTVIDINLFDPSKNYSTDVIQKAWVESHFSPTQRHSQQQKMSDVCSICLGELRSNIGVVVPCGHCFHVKCFEDYVKHQRIEKSGNHFIKNVIDTTLPSCPMCKQDSKMFQKIFLCVGKDDKKLKKETSGPNKPYNSPSMKMSSKRIDSFHWENRMSERESSSADLASSFSFFSSTPPSIRSFHVDAESEQGNTFSNQHMISHQHDHSPSYAYGQYPTHTNVDSPMPPLTQNTISSFAIDSFQRSYFRWWQMYSRNNCYCNCYDCVISRSQNQDNVRYI